MVAGEGWKHVGMWSDVELRGSHAVVMTSTNT